MFDLSRAGWSLSSLAPGSLNRRLGLALAVLLLAHLLFHTSSGEEIGTRGGTLADFVEHVRERGVQLRVVWGARDTGLYDHLYLTEDPDATWAFLQSTPRVVERIDRWRGTVWVGHSLPREDVTDFLDQLGPHGCRVGDFILFGDERILRHIQDVCREAPAGLTGVVDH
jgi:hypothetical protein